MNDTKKKYRIPNIVQVQLSTRNNIFSPQEFKALVKYERIRADRNGNSFSVAIFTNRESQRKLLKKEIAEISGFTRAIDCIGWDESGTVSVLLPDTNGQGAAVFARKVIAGMKVSQSHKLSVELYSYPEHWLANSENSDGFPSEDKNKTRSFRNKVESLFVANVPIWKRFMDISGALTVLLLTLPVCLITAAYIKLISPGPVFFKQTRIGYKGIPFTLYKFRTMKHDNNQSFHGKHAQSFILDGDVPMEKLDSRDSRIIPGGKVLRKACVDELPQLWNIIRGDMSLVGPRPCIPYEVQEYLRWHTHRFDTMPGLSGLWQVSGKNKLTFKQMIRLDIKYCQSLSPFQDFAIMVRTPFAIASMVFEAIADKKRMKQVPHEVVAVDVPVYADDARHLVSM